MTKVAFYKPDKIEDEKLRFAVIAARYQDQWVFCRHKQQTAWEIPGGLREPGEAIERTARRKLAEKTGAVEADIHTVSAVEYTEDGKRSCGMLFFAYINSLAALPNDSETGETKLFDVLPENLAHPEIQSQLYRGTQGWLNTQSSAGEMWDIYDANRRFTGRLHRRGDFLDDGEYHLVVHVWLMNSRGEFLLTKRTPNKGFPNMWETTGGSALAGDDSLTAALREVKEETGLSADPDCGSCVMSFRRDNNFVDVWLFQQDFNLDDVVLQEGETCGKMYANADKIKELGNNGLFVPYTYLQQLLDMQKVIPLSSPESEEK